jgi:hypothetical protein
MLIESESVVLIIRENILIAVNLSLTRTDGCRHATLQCCGAHANPNLEMARAALKHHT